MPSVTMTPSVLEKRSRAETLIFDDDGDPNISTVMEINPVVLEEIH
jgi:hypothetical protein